MIPEFWLHVLRVVFIAIAIVTLCAAVRAGRKP